MTNNAEKKIVIITSGQPSANPRAVKEAIALSEEGYLVSVIYAPLSPWADEFDRALFLLQKKIQWIRAGYHPLQNSKKYKLVRLRRKINEWMFRHLKISGNSAENAYVLYAQELIRTARYIKADLYIAHNLGALPAAVKAAHKWNTSAVFDAEDYHRGESPEESLQHILAVKIEDRYIPRLKYLTAASPLIAEAYRHHYPGKKVEVINNVFSLKFLAAGERIKKNGLSLFWFSQTIGKERGLEDICKALGLLNNENIKLYLLGQCSDEIKNYLKGFMVHHPDPNKNIIFLPPCHPDEIFEIAAQFDIGLALEQHISLNREFCLTNKIFTYLLAGNIIIATDTKAQKKFIAENEGIGFIYEAGNIEQLTGVINTLYSNPDIIIDNRNNILALAKGKFNFETESIQLKKLVAEELNSISHPN